MPYGAPTYAPQQPPAVPAASAQPKPIIRAQAPDEPNPVLPPLLTLPSPEKLGVAVRPVANTTDWTAIRVRMNELGLVRPYVESLPDGRSRFTCWLPADRRGLTRRIECVAATEEEAVQVGLQHAEQSRRDRP